MLGLGVRPETGLAKQAGLELDSSGGIRVNDQLQTTDPTIRAAGDAVEVRDAVTQARTLIPLAGPANRQGQIATDNIFGRQSRYETTYAHLAAATGLSQPNVSRHLQILTDSAICGQVIDYAG